MFAHRYRAYLLEKIEIKKRDALAQREAHTKREREAAATKAAGKTLETHKSSPGFSLITGAKQAGIEIE